MKKYFFILAIMSFTTIMGCSKYDSQSNSVNRSTSSETSTDELASKSPYYPGLACFTWYDYDLDTCLTIRHSDVICGLYIGCLSDNTMNIDTYVDDLGNISQIRIKNFMSLPSADAQGISNLIDNGVVNILYDSPIDDQDLLEVLAHEYIPAGSYPIIQIGSDACIEFK